MYCLTANNPSPDRELLGQRALAIPILWVQQKVGQLYLPVSLMVRQSEYTDISGEDNGVPLARLELQIRCARYAPMRYPCNAEVVQRLGRINKDG